MSEYSELIGSFIRTSNFPLEANYIFNSEEDLIQFYNDPINKTTLHKGLLKIVDNGNKQQLYWVIEKDGELIFESFSNQNECTFTCEDRTFIDGIKAGNLSLPTPTITGTWTFYKNDGTEVDRSSISPVPNSTNPTLENGYKAKFSGTYKWAHQDGKKDPTQVQSGSAWSDLPNSNVNSSTYTSNLLTSTTSIKVGIQAAKTGLIVSGTNVVPASGVDTATASVTVTFTTKRFYGNTTSKVPTEESIKQLYNDLGGKSLTVNGVNTSTSEYYVFAYPSSLGNLTSIIQDGATPVLGAFSKSQITITNNAGSQIEYNVYTSNNPGAFQGAKLVFS